MTNHQHITQTDAHQLIQQACRSGASDAALISTGDILIEDNLATLCKDPGCENYGLSKSCPPHVSGPDGFRKRLKNYKQALVFKIDVPFEILISNQRNDWFRLLHEIAAGIEHAAAVMGFTRSRAFAGGSCKQIFCPDHVACRALAREGECRHPEVARPSMSGFGINVTRLLQTVGWPMDNSKTDPDRSATGTISGLVLIC